MIATRIRLALVPVIAGLLLGGGIALQRQTSRSPRTGTAALPEVGGQAGIVLSSDHLDFGEILGNTVAERQLVLRNTGPSSVHLRVDRSGSTFTLDRDEMVLEPGATGRISVRAAPSRTGRLREELRIRADGSGAEPLVVALEGNARGSSFASPTLAENDAPRSEDPPSVRVDETGANWPSIARGPGEAVDDPGVVVAIPGGATPSPAPASLSLTRTASAASPTEPNFGTTVARAASPGAPVVPWDPGARPSRGMADRPSNPPPDAVPRDGEEPLPVPRPTPADDRDGSSSDPVEPTTTPILAVSPASSLTLLGSRNQFYPQQLGVLGSSSGGSFSLASRLELPRVPLAFGQSMQFQQSGSAVGTFDSATGQVTLQLSIHAMDNAGNAAPLALSLTTGTVMARNGNGVLLSASGMPRSAAGNVRLVGIAKIPPGYRNGAEEQLVTLDLVGTLQFPGASEARATTASRSGQTQEDL